jgi:hypothetical protein
MDECTDGDEARRGEAVFLLLSLFSPPKPFTHGSHDYQEQSSIEAGLKSRLSLSVAGEDRTIKMESVSIISIICCICCICCVCRLTSTKRR